MGCAITLSIALVYLTRGKWYKNSCQKIVIPCNDLFGNFCLYSKRGRKNRNNLSLQAHTKSSTGGKNTTGGTHEEYNVANTDKIGNRVHESYAYTLRRTKKGRHNKTCEVFIYFLVICVGTSI